MIRFKVRIKGCRHQPREFILLLLFKYLGYLNNKNPPSPDILYCIVKHIYWDYIYYQHNMEKGSDVFNIKPKTN